MLTYGTSLRDGRVAAPIWITISQAGNGIYPRAYVGVNILLSGTNASHRWIGIDFVNFNVNIFQKRNQMKNLIYVLDLKKIFLKCQKKQHFLSRLAF